MTYPNIDTLRAVIDDLDMQIVTLLSRRYECVKAAAQFKNDAQSVRAPDRVAQVINNVRRRAEARGLSPDLVEAVYKVLIDESITLELRELYGLRK